MFEIRHAVAKKKGTYVMENQTSAACQRRRKVTDTQQALLHGRNLPVRQSDIATIMLETVLDGTPALNRYEYDRQSV